MDNIKITIVTVVYNDKKGIDKTIQSVLTQTYKNIEYVIIDGASNDGTLECIKKYEKDISFWLSEKDQGIYDAMNKGILRANGYLINFMNAGDVFYNEDTIAHIAALYADEDIIYGNILRQYGRYRSKAKGIVNPSPHIIDFLYNTFHHQASFIKKDLFSRVGLYSTSLRLASDWKFFFDATIFHHAIVRHVDITVCVFSMDGISTSNAQDYAEERKKYFQEIYGEEVYSYIEELYYYRSNLLCRKFLGIRIAIKNMFSESLKSRVKIMSRICNAILHGNR